MVQPKKKIPNNLMKEISSEHGQITGKWIEDKPQGRQEIAKSISLQIFKMEPSTHKSESSKSLSTFSKKEMGD